MQKADAIFWKQTKKVRVRKIDDDLFVCILRISILSFIFFCFLRFRNTSVIPVEKIHKKHPHGQTELEVDSDNVCFSRADLS